MLAQSPTLYCTVTTDLVYDQRMIRICTSLAEAGYRVVLVGRQLKASPPVSQQPFEQHRIRCFFEKGFAFYAEYNFRLLLFLLFRKMDGCCAIDLDTMVPVYLNSALKRIPRFYDAHELFCEMQEIVTRKRVYRFWKAIERWLVPKFQLGYTVNEPIRDSFHQLYGVRYEIIRNMAVLRELPEYQAPPERFILYQGAVNEGRSFETLIPAMQRVKLPLIICGDGNFMEQARELVAQYNLQDKVHFKGRVAPDELRSFTRQAAFGLTLFDPTGSSNYHSLANRFFDYLHAGIPQICVDYPAYQPFQSPYPFALMIQDLSSSSLAEAMNKLADDAVLLQNLRANARKARMLFNWQEETKTLIAFYKKYLPLENHE